MHSLILEEIRSPGGPEGAYYLCDNHKWRQPFWGNRTPCRLVWVSRHQSRPYRGWILDCDKTTDTTTKSCGLCRLQNRFWYFKCNLAQGPRDPCQSRLIEVMKIDHCIVLHYLGKYNSDRDMLEQTSTSLVNNHFSHSPPGWEPRVTTVTISPNY